MKVWLVMCEQHYANYVMPEAIFSTQEKAYDYVDKSRLGNDLQIYEVEVDNPDQYIG